MRAALDYIPMGLKSPLHPSLMAGIRRKEAKEPEQETLDVKIRRQDQRRANRKGRSLYRRARVSLP